MPKVAWGQKIAVELSCEGAASIEVQHFDLAIAKQHGAKATIEIDTTELGMGRVELRRGRDERRHAPGATIKCEITDPYAARDQRARRCAEGPESGSGGRSCSGHGADTFSALTGSRRRALRRAKSSSSRVCSSGAAPICISSSFAPTCRDDRDPWGSLVLSG